MNTKLNNDIKVALVDDHVVMRAALAGFISGAVGYNVHFEAGSKQELMAKLKWDEKPDVILMDYSLGNDVGSDCIAQIRQDLGEDIAIIGLSMHQESLIVQEMIEAGANGYLFKGTDTQEMLRAISEVTENGFYINKFTRSMVFGRVASNEDLDKVKLSDIEKDIIKLVCQQFTNEVIADKLDLSPNTVNTYRKRILKKIDCKNTAGLVVFAIKHKIYDI